MENKEKDIILNEINESAEKWKIETKIAEDLFDNIYNIKKDSFKIKNYTDSIYLITVSDVEKYKKYPWLYNNMNRYKNNSEYRELQFMFIKINEVWVEKKKQVYEKFKKIYWDIIKLDESEYYLMVWYFGWTQWRTNQEIIKDMQKLFDVKNLSI